MSEITKFVALKWKRLRETPMHELIALILLVGVMVGLFAFYILKSVEEELAKKGGGERFALFLGLAVAALMLGRVKQKYEQLYGGLAVVFGLGATGAEVAQFKLVENDGHGLNIEWKQMGVIVVAALFVADEWDKLWPRKPRVSSAGFPIRW